MLVAQLDRVSASEAEGQWFKSTRAHQFFFAWRLILNFKDLKAFKDKDAELDILAVEAQKNLKSQIQHLQELTYEERIEAHENALKLYNDLRAIGEERRAESQKPS